MTEFKKKLIEVALPLEAINRESDRDKKLSAGHPTTLHYWWAPRPLPACRAVVFAALVDDPSAHPDRFPDEQSQEIERQRLFTLMGELIKWESRNDRNVLRAARREIMESSDGALPTLFDPFCGRGLIPLEGQRLGLDVEAADLNPVAVLIARTLIELVPRFLKQPAVNPASKDRNLVPDPGVAAGFASDVQYYADLVLERSAPALRPIYPTYLVTPDLVEVRPDLEAFANRELTVLAWLWARTVQCSNPACRGTIPLVGSFWLSKRPKRKYWLELNTDAAGGLSFDIHHGDGSAPPPTKVAGTGGTFVCPHCGQKSADAHVESEGRAGRIGKKLMACIGDGGRGNGRVYLPATDEQERCGLAVEPTWRPDMPIPDYSQAMPTAKQGVLTWADLFTNRQLFTLDALSKQVQELHLTIMPDALAAGLSPDGVSATEGGTGARAYADALVTFLGLVLGKYVNRSCAFSFWHGGRETIEQPFAQQGIQKSWDFVESNPFSTASGGWYSAVQYPLKVIRELYPDVAPGHVVQRRVADAQAVGGPVMVITDPPYYDNMGYADLSDFFYIWERRALQDIHPDLFGTILVPKNDELAAVRHRFGGDRRKAEAYFTEGFQKAFRELAAIQTDDFPLCLFYAYKQKETRSGEAEASTGWETMLKGLMDAGFSIMATWPVLTESTNTIKKTKGSLSTSVVLACRKRPVDAPMSTRRELVNALRSELPTALKAMQRTSIPPVDLPQASIGPGMAIFSRYSKVLDSDGSAMSVRTALGLINQTLDLVLEEQEGEFDSDTRWAISWFEQFGMNPGDYGKADSMSRAKVTSVDGMVRAGILEAKGNQVRLLRRDELPKDWDPATDDRLTVWEMTQQLINRLDEGERPAAELCRRLGSSAEAARDLAYRLYLVCERKKWAQEALAFNGLVIAWPQIRQLAGDQAAVPEAQRGLF